MRCYKRIGKVWWSTLRFFFSVEQQAFDFVVPACKQIILLFSWEALGCIKGPFSSSIVLGPWKALAFSAFSLSCCPLLSPLFLSGLARGSQRKRVAFFLRLCCWTDSRLLRERRPEDERERERGVKSILTICCQSKTLLSPLGSINLASSTFYLYIGVDKGLYEVNEIEYSLFSRLPLLLNSCHNFSIHPKKLRRNKISKTLFFSFHGTGLKNFAFFSSFIQTMGKNLGEWVSQKTAAVSSQFPPSKHVLSPTSSPFSLWNYLSC